jgi:hypothetical protein
MILTRRQGIGISFVKKISQDQVALLGRATMDSLSKSIDPPATRFDLAGPDCSSRCFQALLSIPLGAHPSGAPASNAPTTAIQSSPRGQQPAPYRSVLDGLVEYMSAAGVRRQNLVRAAGANPTRYSAAANYAVKCQKAFSMFTPDEYEAAKTRVLAEISTKAGGQEVSPAKAVELRRWIQERTDLDSDNGTAEQAAWRDLYLSLTKIAASTHPELSGFVRKIENLQAVGRLSMEKRKRHPNDYGTRAWWGFIIMGLLVGWIRSTDPATILLYGFAFCVAGLLFAIFALDSMYVQSVVAIFLYKRLRLTWLGHKLYERALTIHD